MDGMKLDYATIQMASACMRWTEEHIEDPVFREAISTQRKSMDMQIEAHHYALAMVNYAQQQERKEAKQIANLMKRQDRNGS